MQVARVVSKSLSRAGVTLKSCPVVHFFPLFRNPNSTFAFQIGESMQILSGGLLMATPHQVRGTKVPDVTRMSYALFMQPGHLYPLRMPEGASEEKVTNTPHLPPNIPRLCDRFDGKDLDLTFGVFSHRTLNA